MTCVVHVLAAPTGDAHALLARLAGTVAGKPVRIGHACGRCGSGRHGAPTLPGSGLFGSLSRADGLDVVAVTTAGPVGVDVERVGAAEPGLAGVVLHPDEPLDDVTLAWVRKEALLKATGRGLADDPRSIRLDGAHVVEGPDAVLADVDLGSGWVCAVALLGASPVEVRLGPTPTPGPPPAPGQSTGRPGSGAR